MKEYEAATPQLWEESSDFNVQKITGHISRYWKYYLLSVIVCIAMGWLYLRYATPMYQAHAQVLVQNNQRNSSSSFFSSSALSDFGDLFGVKSNVYDEVAVLETSDLVEKVVKQLGLNVKYYFDGSIHDVELYDKSPFKVWFQPVTDSVFSRSFDLKEGTGNMVSISNKDMDFSKTVHFGDTVFTVMGPICITKSVYPFAENGSYHFVLSSTDAVVPGITANLSSEMLAKGSNVINLSYNSNVRKKAEDVLNALISQYIQRSLDEKNNISDSIIGFIESRINLVADDLNNIEARIQGFKVENKLTDITTQSQALVQASSDYYNKLNDIDVQLNVVNTLLQKVQSNSKGPVPSLISTDPGFISLVEKYNGLVTQRDRLLMSTTESNPLIQNLDQQITSTRNDMISNLQNQQQALQASRQKIVSTNAQIGGMVASVPVQERKFIDLSRERDVKQALYLFLLQKKEETAITKASNIPNASIIKHPKANYTPYFPQTMSVYATSLFLGLFLLFCFLWIKGLLTTTISTTEEITSKTGAPILAEIGHGPENGVVDLESDGRAIVAEQFRVFRTNMDFMSAGQQDSKVILVTSTQSSEGKSFVATNLGQVYAVSGKKVLIIEMDLRKPKISKMLNVPNDKGLTSFIISDNLIDEYITPLELQKTLFLLPSGPIPPNPAELLLSDKVNSMFKELRLKFDVIIVDTPPIAIVADAQIIGAYADISLYIIRQGVSKKEAFRIINNIISQKKLPQLGIAVNDLKSSNSYKYGYSYKYGHDYYH